MAKRHKSGMLQNKPNTWRDFIACAEYLIKQGYTSSAKLAGQGGSAGGILIGRAFTERPELFAAAISDVGLSDMIRDMFSPDGPLNVPEYGDLKDQQGFQNLFEISAYYHVKDGVHYPAVMITTGMNDPRVVPWEPGKMAARLQQPAENLYCCVSTTMVATAPLVEPRPRLKSWLLTSGASCSGSSVFRPISL